MRRVAQTFMAGLLAALPLIVTVAVTAWLIAFISSYIGPNSRIGQLIASLGLGVTTSNVAPYLAGLIVVALAIYLLGLLVETRLAGWLSPAIDGLIQRIPVISSVYGLSKQFTSIVDLKGSDSLKGMSPVWCFFGGEESAAVLALLASPKPVMIGAHAYLGVLVPSAPVPVGG
ncbi:MAG: DUF502 domain-containing protein, partial [Hyphomicrobiaceae bacterium]